MGKKIKAPITLALLLAMLTLGTLAPLQNARTDQSDWMASLSGDRSLGSLSIPGTHDSGALYSLLDVFGKCQTMPVSQQLKAGVRFLDLRLRLVEDELWIYHNFVEQKTDFQTMLEELVRFLREHPSEFLIVSLKEEASPIRSQVSFADTLEAMLSGYPDVVNTARALPETVGEARGMIQILARYGDASVGVPCADGWKDNTSFAIDRIYVQDHYQLSDTSEKIPDIERTFALAASGAYQLVLNYTSCYLSVSFPPAYAGVTALEINPWLRTRLPETTGPLGVMVCDFMTSELAQLIIERNF